MIGHIKSGQYLKNIARAILKKYWPPHKARGIHDFILATKSSVWIMIYNTFFKCALLIIHERGLLVKITILHKSIAYFNVKVFMIQMGITAQSKISCNDILKTTVVPFIIQTL